MSQVKPQIGEPSRREATRRIAKLLDRIPARLLNEYADVWEKLTAEIPVHLYDRQQDCANPNMAGTRGYASTAEIIARLIPVLSMLGCAEVGAISNAVTNAILTGRLMHWHDYPFFELARPQERGKGIDPETESLQEARLLSMFRRLYVGEKTGVMKAISKRLKRSGR